VTNSKQQRRLLIEQLLEAKNPRWIFAEVSPYSDDFWQTLDRQVELATKDLFHNVARELPELPAWAALANAWAIAAEEPVWLALLARATADSVDEALLRERRRLLRLTRDSLARDPCAEAILTSGAASPGAPPDLGDSHFLMPGLRLRYALAHRWSKGATTLSLLQVACNQRDVSTFVRARELMHAMEAAKPNGRRLSALSQAEFESAPPRMQAVVISRPDLKARMLPAALLEDQHLAERVRDARQRARVAKSELIALRECLRAQDLTGAESLLGGLSLDVATRDQATVVFARLGALPSEGERRRSRHAPSVSPDELAALEWAPLSKSAWRRLAALAPGLSVPPWWRWTASHVAKLVARKRFSAENMPAADLARIRRGWTEEEHGWLLAARRYGLVPAESTVWDDSDLLTLCEAAAANSGLLERVGLSMQSMRDARPVLALLGKATGQQVRGAASSALAKGVKGLAATDWLSWVAPCIGTAEWHANPDVAGAGVGAVRAAVGLLRSGGVPVDIDGFRRAVCSMLAASSGASPGEELLRSFLEIDSDAIPEVARLVPLERLEVLVREQKLEPELLARLEEAAPGPLRDTIWSLRLTRAESADRLLELMLKHPQRLGDLPWNAEWLHLRGQVDDKALALVLASRCDPDRLNAICDSVGEIPLRKALAAAAPILPSKLRRDRGYLQLATVLGRSHFSNLRTVLFLSEKNAPTGCKFDRCYREYLLPKKSGGNRVISVPPRPLKRVQKAILAKLIAPLGAHDAAFGFVPKRSIHDNASVHVGQNVVANADVENCFPNIKWSLVLGVLRRDLGHQLGPAAISPLVDICTSKGGLPIGAPTSPALLNRVLLRTDDLVQRAAVQRECRYTRYADDLTFSGDHRAVEMIGVAKRTLAQIGLRLDAKKTSIYRPGRRQMVTGLVVNEQVSIPRRLRRRLRAAVHAVERGHQPHWHGHEHSLASLMGRLAFLGQIHPEQGQALKTRLRAAQPTEESPGDG